VDPWKTEVLRILRVWTGGSRHDPETLGILALTLIAALLAHAGVSRSVRSPRGGAGRSSLLIVITLAMALSVTAAFDLYVLPRVANPVLQQWIPIFCPIGVCLILAAPLGMWLHRMNYFESLFALALSVAAAVVVGFLVRGALRAGGEGLHEFLKTKGHTEDINRVL
jgi:hypothetical protein